VFHLRGKYVLPTRNDQIALAVNNVKVPLPVEIAHISGLEPGTSRDTHSIFGPVTQHHVPTRNLNLSHTARRTHGTRVIDDSHGSPSHGAAAGREQVVARWLTRAEVITRIQNRYHPYLGGPIALRESAARPLCMADRSDLLVVHRLVRTGIALLETVSTKLRAESDEAAVLFAAKAYLDLAGLVAVAWMWLRIAAAAAGKSDARSSGKHASARFFASYYEPEMHVHAARVLTALDNESKHLRTSHSA
jgi:hypothetical protein